MPVDPSGYLYSIDRRSSIALAPSAASGASSWSRQSFSAQAVLIIICAQDLDHFRVNVVRPSVKSQVPEHDVDSDRRSYLETSISTIRSRFSIYLSIFIYFQRRVSKHGLSGYLRELHGEGAEKRYHMNDMLLYCQRTPVFSGGAQLVTPSHGTTPVAISSSRLEGNRRGGRAVLLRC